MKFQVMKSPWCNSTESKWTIIELGDSTFVKMGTIEKRGCDILAYVEIKLEPSGETRYHTIEWITSEALFQGMYMIEEHTKIPGWRRDFGQI